MDAWGKWTNVSDKVIMAADGNGDFVKATGLVQGKFLNSFFNPPTTTTFKETVKAAHGIPNTPSTNYLLFGVQNVDT